jgi:hypothetical protein
MTPFLAPTVLTLVLGASLVACGGGDQAPVCDSAENLKTSVENLKDVNVTANGLSALESQLTTIKADLRDLKDDVTSEFSAQITAIDTSYSALKASADTARSDPSVPNLAAVASAVSALGADARQLVDDVGSTC